MIAIFGLGANRFLEKNFSLQNVFLKEMDFHAKCVTICGNVNCFLKGKKESVI